MIITHTYYATHLATQVQCIALPMLATYIASDAVN